MPGWPDRQRAFHTQSPESVREREALAPHPVADFGVFEDRGLLQGQLLAQWRSERHSGRRRSAARTERRGLYSKRRTWEGHPVEVPSRGTKWRPGRTRRRAASVRRFGKPGVPTRVAGQELPGKSRRAGASRTSSANSSGISFGITSRGFSSGHRDSDGPPGAALASTTARRCCFLIRRRGHPSPVRPRGNRRRDRRE